MWNAVKRRVGGEMNQFLEALNQDLLGSEEGHAGSGAAFMRSPGRSRAGGGLGLDEGEGPMEEGYKAALVRFQLDQIKVTKEYQQLLGEKEAEVSSLSERWIGRVGSAVPSPPPPPPSALPA